MEKIVRKIREFFREWKWEIGGVALLLFSVFVNLFPEGYVIVGGDVAQLIRLGEGNYETLFYEGFGRYSLFYSFFYLLDSIGVSATAQLSWYLGLFLFGSYGSFLAFSRLLFPRIRGAVLAFGALFYATNLYTLYLFTSTWGFTHYSVLYVFIPILTGLFIRTLRDPGTVFFPSLLLFLAISSMSFSNPAYALSLGIYLLILLFSLLAFRMVRLSWKTFGTLVVVALFGAALNAYWALPVATQMGAGVKEVSASTDIDLPVSLRKTSNAIFDTLRMVQTHEKELFYPYNFPYPDFKWMKPVLVVLSFVPIVVVLLGFLAFRRSWKSHGSPRLFFAFFLVLAALVPLVARVRTPFEFNDFLFQLPGVNVLRGYDKLAIYTPFLIVSLSMLAIASREGKRHFRAVLVAAFALVFLLGLPFFVGGIQTKLSAAFANDSAKDFRKAKYSSLVKIPVGYETLSTMELPGGKITALPFSPAPSVGRIDLSKWKANGPSIVPRFIRGASYVEPNEDYIPGIRFARDYDDLDRDPEKILDLYGLIGIRYVIYHKDVPTDRFRKAEPAREYMEEREFIRKVSETESFFVYQLDDWFVFPRVFFGSDGFSVNPKTVDISARRDDLRRSLSETEYVEINPKHIRIPVGDVSSGEVVYLNEKYDSLWKATYVAPDGSRRPLERSSRVNFANAWSVGSGLSGGEIEILHESYRWLVLGLRISGSALLIVIFFLAYRIMKQYGWWKRKN